MWRDDLRELQKRCAELTQALEEQQFLAHQQASELTNLQQQVQAKDREIVELQKYKAEFLTNISHELRTPLNSILMLSEIFAENREENLTARQVEFAATIYSAGLNLTEVINESLDFAALESQMVIVQPQRVVLQAFLTEVEQAARTGIERKGILFTCELGDGVPTSIRTDRGHLLHIIKILLSNALKFTPGGAISLVIQRPDKRVDLSRSGLQPQHSLAIAIRDTGIGIPHEKQALIFEAFRQIEGGLTRKYEGTGLGLSIAASLTKLIGGEIQVTSQEQQGSTFTIYLPEVLIECQTTPPVSPATVLEIESAFSFLSQAEVEERLSEIASIRDDRNELTVHDLSLLIIEDDPKTVKILFTRAHQYGFKCLIAGDGEAGLQLADQFAPRAIFLNLILPGLPGWKVMERLKDNLETRHIPVYVISSQQKAREMMRMGALGYVNKPLTVDTMERAFQHLRLMIAKTRGKLLILEEGDAFKQAMMTWVGEGQVVIVNAKTMHEIRVWLTPDELNCILVDLEHFAEASFECLEALARDPRSATLPIVVYRPKGATPQDAARLAELERVLLLKKAHTLERVLDEVSLFLHLRAHDLPPTQQKMLEMLHPGEATLHQKRILLVDDDIRAVFELSAILEERGAEVLVAESAHEMLARLQHDHKIDVVLVNMTLPDMEGTALITYLRNEKQWEKLPLIAMKIEGVRGDRRRYIKAGANEYLSKPVDPERLLSLLRVWLF